LAAAAMSPDGTFRTWRDVRLESGMRFKPDIAATKLIDPSGDPMRVFAIRIERPLDVTIERLHHAGARTSFVEIAILRFLLFAFMKAFQDRRAPWYQRGLIHKPLRKIGVILLHDVERRSLGELAMVLGK
jgi:hypothetical protein